MCGKTRHKREMGALCLIAQQQRAVAAADFGDAGNIRTCAIVVWACNEYGVRPPAGKRCFDCLRRYNAAKRPVSG